MQGLWRFEATSSTAEVGLSPRWLAVSLGVSGAGTGLLKDTALLSFSWPLSLPSPRTGGGLLVGGQALCTNGLKGGFQFGICQHMCPRGRTSFQKYLLPRVCVCVCVCVPRDSPVAFCLWRRSKIRANGDHPGSFQITTSALGVRACPLTPAAVQYISPAGLQNQIFWELIFWV